MSLDLHVKCKDEVFYFEISETLHSSIFSNSTRWRSFKRLRKIKDYYRADCLFKNDEGVAFLQEFISVCELVDSSGFNIAEMKSLMQSNKIEYVRVSGD
jgi:hypothetical protein